MTTTVTLEQIDEIVALLRRPKNAWTAEEQRFFAEVLLFVEDFNAAEGDAGLEVVVAGKLPDWLPEMVLFDFREALFSTERLGREYAQVCGDILYLFRHPEDLRDWCARTNRSALYWPYMLLLRLKILCKLSEKEGLVELFGQRDGLAMYRGRRQSGHKKSADADKAAEYAERRAALKRFIDDWNHKHPSGPLHRNRSEMGRHLLKMIADDNLPDYLVGHKLPQKSLRKLLAI